MGNFGLKQLAHGCYVTAILD